MANKWLDRLMPKPKKQNSWLRNLVAGSLYRISDCRTDTSFSDIKTQIATTRASARDSQISTALSYYATDATTTNTDGQIIWAVPINKQRKDVAEIINALFNRWNVNAYARDHILELATIGNLYIPTTDLYKTQGSQLSRELIALDNNTIPDQEFDIVPSYKIPPEDVIHLYKQGKSEGYILQPDETVTTYIRYPESSIIHFSLCGWRVIYTSDAMIRVVKFVNVECGSAEEEEQRNALQMIKDAIEQQLSINTLSGDAQPYLNPNSPNNLIYLPKINGQDPISITDLNMAEANDADNKLLEYYQNKKLSVLGVPKEAMNFSSNEGLGGAGAVLSQRSALYANSLQRLETAYMAGWREAINKYFIARNMSGFVDQFKLQMQPIVTNMSTVISERRDSAVGQALQLVDLMKNLGVTAKEPYLKAIRSTDLEY